jgi:hypothetical protein
MKLDVKLRNQEIIVVIDQYEIPLKQLLEMLSKHLLVQANPVVQTNLKRLREDLSRQVNSLSMVEKLSASVPDASPDENKRKLTEASFPKTMRL